jgi:hypothetical protein
MSNELTGTIDKHIKNDILMNMKTEKKLKNLQKNTK